jgi:capsular exopolysaccharide synthesis family protein
VQIDDNIRSPEDLQQKLGLPLLGTVPPTTGDLTVIEELADAKSPISEAYNSIRAALLLSSRDGLPRRIVLTSAQPSEGKTSSVYALAQGLGRIKRRVVVVDLDMRRPTLHKNFGVSNDRGASEFLAGSIHSVDELIKPVALENVSFISCGTIPPNPTELLSGESLDRLLNTLAERFDVVLLDAPPILGLADAVILASHADATVFVVEAGRNHAGSSKNGAARLVKGGGNIVGGILTKYDARKSGYGYGYQYNYHYRYGDGEQA